MTDRVCLDCALGRCAACLYDDPNPPGRRECCCGVLDDRLDHYRPRAVLGIDQDADDLLDALDALDT